MPQYFNAMPINNLDTAVSPKTTPTENTYESFFDSSPISLWVEDFSDVKIFIDQLKQKGITNFNAYFENHPEDVAYCAGLVNVIDVNQATVKLFKASGKADLTGKLGTIFREDSLILFRKELIQLANGQTSLEHESHNYTLDGERIDIIMQLTAVSGHEETLDRVIIAITDIGKQKRAEAALQENLNFTQTILDNIPTPVFYKDEEGRYVGCNDAFAKHAGFPKNEIIGKTTYDLIPKELADAYTMQDKELYQNGGLDFIEGIRVNVNEQEDKSSVYYKKAFYNPKRSANWIIGVLFDVTERKKTEQQARLQAAALEAAANAILITDENGFINWVNPAFTNLTGHTLPEVIGKTPRILDSTKNDQTMHQSLWQTITSGQIWHASEQLNERKDGSSYYEKVTISPVKDEAGNISNFIAIKEDITDQLKAEKQILRQFQEEEVISYVLDMTNSNFELTLILEEICTRMTHFFQISQTTITLFDELDGSEELVTHYTMPELGTTIENLTDSPDIRFLLKEQRTPIVISEKEESKWSQSLKQTMQSLGVASGLIVPIIIEQKVAGFLEFNSLEAKDFREDDFMMGRRIAIHISEAIQRQKAKQLLQLQRDFAQQVMDNMGQGLLVFNQEWCIEYCNPAVAFLLGYTDEELINEHGTQLLYDPSGKEQSLFSHHWLQGEVQSLELRLKTIDGSPVDALITAVPRWHENKINGTIIVITDLTQRKQIEADIASARDQAVEASRLKSEFLANMSHEIRTPLNAVIGLTSLLIDTPLDEEQQDFARTIRSSSDVLLSLINDILDLSKIEAGKLELEERPFDLRTCIEESLDVVVPKATEKGLEIAYHIEEGVPQTIISDVVRLRQVLVNLLNNAIKFTSKGEVFLKVYPAALENYFKRSTPDGNPLQSLRFAIKDTGIGIPEDRRNRLFKSFSQVDASTTRQYGGTGLGLAISKHLVEKLGGQIGVESEEGIGSTFYFTILAEAGIHVSRVYQKENQPQLAGKRMIIVDDNETNRFILSKQLEKWGIKSVAAVSGSEALSQLHNNCKFDLAVLDMHMPEMDGVELAAKIRQHWDEAALPLMMLSSVGDREEYRGNNHFSAFLTKPVKPEQLHKTLISLFSETAVPVTPVVKKPEIDSEMASRHPLRILLAEDNLVNQKVALRILQRMGYEADVANNGVEVLESMRNRQYDVVLMDIQMPQMDGVTATQEIRKQWEASEQPQIIAMTAHALTGDREKYLKSGMDNYISKPVRIHELIETLMSCHPLPSNS